jgi:hypothetical protein
LQALPALFRLGESPGERVLAYWLPDVWQQRQSAAEPGTLQFLANPKGVPPGEAGVC